MCARCPCLRGTRRFFHPRFVWVDFDPASHTHQVPGSGRQHHSHHGPALCWAKGTKAGRKYKVAPAALFLELRVGVVPPSLTHGALRKVRADVGDVSGRSMTLVRGDKDSALDVDLVVRACVMMVAAAVACLAAATRNIRFVRASVPVVPLVPVVRWCRLFHGADRRHRAAIRVGGRAAVAPGPPRLHVRVPPVPPRCPWPARRWRPCCARRGSVWQQEAPSVRASASPVIRRLG